MAFDFDYYKEAKIRIANTDEWIKKTLESLKPISKESKEALQKRYEENALNAVGPSVKKLPVSHMMELLYSVSAGFKMAARELMMEENKKQQDLEKKERQNKDREEAIFLTYGEKIIDFERYMLYSGLSLEDKSEQKVFLEKYKKFEEKRADDIRSKAEEILNKRIRNWYDLPQEEKELYLNKIGYVPDDTVVNKINNLIKENLASDINDKTILDAGYEFIDSCKSKDGSGMSK